MSDILHALNRIADAVELIAKNPPQEKTVRVIQEMAQKPLTPIVRNPDGSAKIGEF